jgi:hypothetical protein
MKINFEVTMSNEWQALTRLTGGEPLEIQKVRLTESGISIEGDFELPPLARLTMEDQIFVTAFIRSHGSIKEMEELFGVSYPTVKNRLNRISQALEFVDVDPPASQNEVLDQLDRGDISVEDALRILEES